MVQVEYCVDPPRADAFRSAMSELGQNRRRDGAMQWWVFQDTADPLRFVETWIEATWADHLRNHERTSVAYQELEQRIRDLTRSGSTITTRHFIAPEPRPSTNAVVREVEERTKC
jgi:quinol monooxygenase YgiN